MAVISTMMSWYFRKRLSSIDTAIKNAPAVQLDVLKRLISDAKDTEWGRQYDFKSIQNYNDFKNRFPIQDYETLKPLIDRVMKGESDILWPGEIIWFAKSSGTTNDKSKFIPVSYETLEECHFQGGKDILTYYLLNAPDSDIFDGKSLLIGGSHKINSFNDSSYYGDLSAVLMNNMPTWANLLKTPDKSIALMDDWELKLEKMANQVINENVTSISGVPTWTLVLLEKLLLKKGVKDISEVWPNLQLYIHGGVSFAPYRDVFKNLIGNSKMRYLETYNASEGFFGLQNDLLDPSMLLMPDYGIFYEFVKVSDLDQAHPQTYLLGEVETGINYAIIISNNSGLWRYQIGDTIVFSSTQPYKFTITGRTKLFINAFGEEVVIDNAERAIAHACSMTDSKVREYTAAPIYLDQKDQAGHEWLIEFEKEPHSIHDFATALDSKLKEVNSDYEAKRHKDIALKMPKIQTMPGNTFYNWLKFKGKLGGQHKVPRLSNDRKVVDEILSLGSN
ncbi:MAG: GH3 auxin-responsive promoter family protein [Bacteroidia bacterium]|nr:GH3 auxin-responsive promoter family protein [Bacteroidia bacterium]